MSDIRIPTLSANTENTEPDSIISDQLMEVTHSLLFSTSITLILSKCLE